MVKDKPLGIAIIALLTFIASGVYYFFAAMVVGIWGMTGGATGEGGNGWSLSTLYHLGILPFFLMALYAFLLAISILVLDSKYVWFAAIIFWILSIILFVSYTILSPHFGEADLLPLDFTMLIVPLTCNIGCIAYFMTPHIRKYFDV